MDRCLILPLGLLLSAVPAAAADQDVQAWTLLSANFPVSGPVSGTLDLGARFSDDRGGLGVALVRGSVNYRLNDMVSIAAGYVHFGTFQDGRTVQREDRPYQQLTLRLGHVARAALSSRTRLEQRFVSTGDDTGWRVRQQVRLAWPLSGKGKSAFYVSEEPFFALNSTDWGARAGFDQLRSAAGFSLPAGKHLTADIGYLNQWTVRRGRPDGLAHVLNVALSIAL